jgi:hypothetical protein
MNRPLIKEIFWLSLLISVMHYAALKFFYYWTISWYDILMHLMGGFLIALIAIYILINFFHSAILEDKKITAILILSFVLIVGLGWELWELFLGFTDVIADRFDTLIDILMDFIGGYFAFLYNKKFLWNKN